jgi:nucleoside 2-deoxyribosyltransferase
MKVFLAYRHTGEDLKELEDKIGKITKAIEECKHEHFCMFYKEDEIARDKWTGKQIMTKAYEEIDSSDVILFFVDKKEISEGMLLEVGYCIAKKKKIILLIKDSVEKHILKRNIDNKIEFKDIDDLANKLKEAKL